MFFSSIDNYNKLSNFNRKSGDPGGNRTRDNLIKSQGVLSAIYSYITDCYIAIAVPHYKSIYLFNLAVYLAKIFCRGTNFRGCA